MKPAAWHEKNVLKKARYFSKVFVTTAGYGRPLAQAGHWLNEAVEQWESAKLRERAERKKQQEEQI